MTAIEERAGFVRPLPFESNVTTIDGRPFPQVAPDMEPGIRVGMDPVAIVTLMPVLEQPTTSPEPSLLTLDEKLIAAGIMPAQTRLRSKVRRDGRRAVVKRAARRRFGK